MSKEIDEHLKCFNRCFRIVEILEVDAERIRKQLHNTHVAMAKAHKALEDARFDLLPMWPRSHGPREYFLYGRVDET